MKQRILSAVGLWAVIILALVVIGPQAGVWLVAAVAFLTQLELYRLFEKIGYQPLRRLGLTLGLLIVMGAYYLPRAFYHPNGGAGISLTVLSIVVCCAAVLTQIKKGNQGNPLPSLMATLFGIIYVPFMLQFLVMLLAVIPNSTAATFTAFWIVVVAKFTDIGGLFVGLKMGKHKLIQQISPGKTWEGAVGGMVVAAAVGTFFVGVFEAYFPFSFTWWHAAFVALPIAVTAIVSDLIESIIKRQAGVKDSGELIPGIGGVFDLSDSLILSAPVGYCMIVYTVI